MATKKPTSSSSSSRTKPAGKPASKPTPKATSPGKLHNLAARPSFNDMLDEQLADNSGVFRVTSAIAQAQAGHEEDDAIFPGASGSLPIARGGEDFRDDGPTLEDPLADRVIQDEAAQVEKRGRLATLAARAKARNRTR